MKFLKFHETDLGQKVENDPQKVKSELLDGTLAAKFHLHKLKIN